MAKLSYNIAKKLCISAGITTRDEYRDFRSKDISKHNQLPAETSMKSEYGKQWTGWNDFLRNPEIIPSGAENLGNHYYRFENEIYSHTPKGFKRLAKRLHPSGKWISDIRTEDGKVVSVYLDKNDIPVSSI
ncbi:hypothetical protein [Flavobacterium mekongense]|uniref:hypothetical protein n=1 Tax=Flavobacterium mekongense TaxID=3379707 RepID=UPI003999D822